ncbi:hypothetical protein FACS189449_04910 [Alphaproteobacteria bacterium]|nr:hypothetical protein FACS189449_04910 [Alphaproteobacteria bacterium]
MFLGFILNGSSGVTGESASEAFVSNVAGGVNYVTLLCSKLNDVDLPAVYDFRIFDSNDSFSTASLEPKCSVSVDKENSATKKSDISKTVKKTGSSDTGPVEVVKNGEFAGARVVKSKIKSSFYVDARKLGVPAGVVDAIVRNMSSKVDFRRSLKAGDSFKILYSKKNELLCSKISTKRGEVTLYGFSDKKTSSYFFANGEKTQQRSSSNGSTSFGAPLSGRLIISDPYGPRRHPVTGKYHTHTGVDFRAPYGSPVYAIYDGVVSRASYYSGYGLCVDIRHPDGYSSRYGHLSKYAVRCGAKVKRGQLIAYVGSSGVSTGSHVHLELAKNNVVMNPLSMKMMPTVTAKQMAPNMKAFRSFVGKVDGILKGKQRETSS